MADSPEHLTLIPDGNARWAAERGHSIFYAYKEGAERAREAIAGAGERGIHTVSFWGLSTDNWRKRPPEELDFLVHLFMDLASDYTADADQHGVRVIHLGRKDRLPESLLEHLAEVESATAGNSSRVLNLALDYGGQDELTRAAERMVADAIEGTLKPEDVSRVVSNTGKMAITGFSEYLDTAGQPHPFPDLVIRTSGEQRTSGWMPWQSVYAELYFPNCYWPEFDARQMDLALADFAGRQRRFGGGHEPIAPAIQ